MKTFLGKKSLEDLSLQDAQGCLASNLVMPGVGSLAAGRKIGLAQLALCLAGFGLTLVFGTRFVLWVLAHWTEFYGANPEPDPLVRLRDLWREGRWSFLGMALFAIAWLWSLLTSWLLLAKIKSRAPVLKSH